MVFYRPYRIHNIHTGEQLFRGVGLCAQQVYEDYRRHKGHAVGVPEKAIDSQDKAERAAALRQLKLQENWIDDSMIFMVAEEPKR